MLKHSQNPVIRSHSLGRSDAVSATWSRKESLPRPASFCDTAFRGRPTRVPATNTPFDINRHSFQNYSSYSINRLCGSESPNRLLRVPSQANNLSTTVPIRITSAPLGERHAPTKHSLKHSRMVAMSKRKQYPQQRPLLAACEMRRLWALVLAVQIIVGSVGVGLALWVLFWIPGLRFKEVPHYASVPVLLSGILGGVFLGRLTRQDDCLSQTVKSLVVTLCAISTITCSCVTAYISLHLIYLAPMTCSSVGHYGLQPLLKIPTNSEMPEWRPGHREETTRQTKPDRSRTSQLDRMVDVDYDYYEGSGDLMSMWVRDYHRVYADGENDPLLQNESRGFLHINLVPSVPEEDSEHLKSLSNKDLPKLTKESNVTLSTSEVSAPIFKADQGVLPPPSLDQVSSTPTSEAAETPLTSSPTDPSRTAVLSYDVSVHQSDTSQVPDTYPEVTLAYFNTETNTLGTEELFTLGDGDEDSNEVMMRPRRALLQVVNSTTQRRRRDLWNGTTLACHCQSHHLDFVRTKTYPGLTCHEVKNLLPIVFVAIVVVMATGAILSVVIIYVTCAGSSPRLKRRPKESELKPFLKNSTTRSAHS